jgi:hypothetical protein
MAQEKMTGAQCPIRKAVIGVMQIEPDRLLDVGDRSLWLPYDHQRLAETVMCTSVIAIERYRRFALDPRFNQAVLDAAEIAHCLVGR